MKRNSFCTAVILCLLTAVTAWAAPRGGMGRPGMMGGGPGGGMMGGGMSKAAKLSGAMTKVFGEHSAFSADLETQASGEANMSMPGKIAFDKGLSRFEMDMAQAKSKEMGAEMAAQMKAMGMDRMVIISNPAKKVSYTIYPAMEAYVETELQDAPTPEKVESYKVKTTELGKDTFDGHPTVKNKVVVTDDTNAVYEATLWNATDLKNFPVKIESENEGVKTVMIFKNVKLTKPDASQFEIPSGYKKYGNMMELMQQMVMKQMGGMGAPGAPGRTRPDNQ